VYEQVTFLVDCSNKVFFDVCNFSNNMHRLRKLPNHYSTDGIAEVCVLLWGGRLLPGVCTD
jgi:hypothetical protein